MISTINIASSIEEGYKRRIIRVLGTGGVPYYGQCSNVCKVVLCGSHNLLLVHETTGAMLKPPQSLTQCTTAFTIVQCLEGE